MMSMKLILTQFLLRLTLSSRYSKIDIDLHKGNFYIFLQAYTRHTIILKSWDVEEPVQVFRYYPRYYEADSVMELVRRIRRVFHGKRLDKASLMCYYGSNLSPVSIEDLIEDYEVNL